MHDVIGILLLIAIVGLFASIPISIVMSVRADQREWDERKKKDEEWLAAELLKPRFVIEFVTTDGVTRNTGPHDPYHTHPGSKWSLKADSKQFADSCLAGAYERGYFMDENNNSYPTCNILQARVTLNG